MNLFNVTSIKLFHQNLIFFVLWCFCFRGESLHEVSQNQNGFCLWRVSLCLFIGLHLHVVCLHNLHNYITFMTASMCCLWSGVCCLKSSFPAFQWYLVCILIIFYHNLNQAAIVAKYISMFHNKKLRIFNQLYLYTKNVIHKWQILQTQTNSWIGCFEIIHYKFGLILEFEIQFFPPKVLITIILLSLFILVNFRYYWLISSQGK